MKTVGLSVEQLSPDEAARRYPQMGFRDVRAVFFEPAAGYITARVACELVRDTFVREGGSYTQAWVRPGTTRGGRLTSVSLSDASTLEATQMMLESRVVDRFPLNDQEVLIRHLHKVACDWVESHDQRTRIPGAR